MIFFSAVNETCFCCVHAGLLKCSLRLPPTLPPTLDLLEASFKGEKVACLQHCISYRVEILELLISELSSSSFRDSAQKLSSGL